MNIRRRSGLSFFNIGRLVVCLVATGAVCFAQSPSTGRIEGRVLDAERGGYLENARVTIEGTQLEAFTDAGGFYQLSNVPAGAAKLRVFFTGLGLVSETVSVAP